jgi:hypothetical protein
MVDPVPLCCAVNHPDPDDLVSSQTFFFFLMPKKHCWLLGTQLLYLPNGLSAFLPF